MNDGLNKEPDKVIIALDFDDTFTISPTFWLDFIRRVLDQGWEIICVTYRDNTTYDRIELEQAFLPYKIPIYFTGGQAKADYMQTRGIIPTIWIDDSPEFILR